MAGWRVGGKEAFQLFDVLYNFSMTATTVVLPFYLLSEGVDVGRVGFLFALLYAAIPIARLLTGYLVDAGRGRVVVVLAPLAAALSSLLYALATLTAVAVGQAMKALSVASFWAFQRVEALRLGGRGFLAFTAGLTLLAYGVGYVAAAVLLYLSSPEVVFYANALLFLIAFLYALRLPVPKGRPPSLKRVLQRRGKAFRVHALINGLLRAWVLVVSTLLVPYLLSHRPPWEGVLFVGALYAALSLGVYSGKAMSDRLYKATTVMALLALSMLGFTSHPALLPLLFFFAGVLVEREELGMLRYLRKGMMATDMALYWVPTYAAAALLSWQFPALLNGLLHAALAVPLLYHLIK